MKTLAKYIRSTYGAAIHGESQYYTMGAFFPHGGTAYHKAYGMLECNGEDGHVYRQIKNDGKYTLVQD